jgi:hypothetical protein
MTHRLCVKSYFGGIIEEMLSKMRAEISLQNPERDKMIRGEVCTSVENAYP